MAAFDDLDEEHRHIFNLCLERYLAYIEAQSALVVALGDGRKSGKKRQRLDAAKTDLTIALAVLGLLEVEARGRGQVGALDWYGRLHKAMTLDDRRAWESFNSILFEDVADFLEGGLLSA